MSNIHQQNILIKALLHVSNSASKVCPQDESYICNLCFSILSFTVIDRAEIRPPDDFQLSDQNLQPCSIASEIDRIYEKNILQYLKMLTRQDTCIQCSAAKMSRRP